MNISSINANGALQGPGGTDPADFRTRMQQAMAPVAQLFGTTPEQLMQAVQESGGTLSDYAASKGISQTDLTAAIKQGLQSNAPNGTQLSDTQLTNIADRIENHKPHGHHHHGAPPADPTAGSGVTGDASAIKSDLEKLMADLKAAGATGAVDPTATTTDPTDSTSTNSVSTNALLDLLSRFDQQL
jgi:hypothetical protein